MVREKQYKKIIEYTGVLTEECALYILKLFTGKNTTLYPIITNYGVIGVSTSQM